MNLSQQIETEKDEQITILNNLIDIQDKEIAKIKEINVQIRKVLQFTNFFL